MELEQHHEPRRAWPTFDTPNILWFFGAVTATGACDTVLTRVHPGARGAWLLLASLAVLIGFAAISAGLLRAGWWVPGGVLAAMAVTFVVPIAIAFEKLIGVSQPAIGPGPLEEFDGSVFAVVVALALAGVAAFSIVRFHFVLAIVAVATFLAAQLLVPALVDLPGPGTFATAFVIVGGILLVAGLAFDLSPTGGQPSGGTSWASRRSRSASATTPFATRRGAG